MQHNNDMKQKKLREQIKSKEGRRTAIITRRVRIH